MKKNNKGITLITLIVTIVVLLILAGVLIKSSLDINGVVNKSEETVGELNKKIAKDDDEVQDILSEMKPESLKISQATGNGNLSEGTGEEQSPYLIQSIEDLVKLSNNVNAGNTYQGKTFKLLENLDFNNPKSYIDATRKDFDDVNKNGVIEELKTELTTGIGFNPIGINENGDIPFQGIFDGNNKSIINLYQNIPATDVWSGKGHGFIGCIADATVKNLSLVNANINNSYGFSGIVGKVLGTANLIENCKVSGQIYSMTSAGGMIGIVYNNAKVEIKNCYNAAKVTSNEYAGGLVGGQYGGSNDYIKMTNCQNNGNVSSNGYYAGGLIGITVYGGTLEINNCSNNGIVTSTVSSGGMIGYCCNDEITISNCQNNKKVGGKNGSVGGMAGYISRDNAIVKITNCQNNSDVSGERYIGGITGRIGNCGSIEIINSKNTGNITGEVGQVGGILGVHDSVATTLVENCVNEGKITCNGTETGGIIGAEARSTSTTIRNCANLGQIKGGSYKTAGVVGYIESSGKITIENCYNSGSISALGQYGSMYIGGIAGELYISGANSTAEILNCNNSGEISGADYIGGIVGERSGNDYSVLISKCYNKGNITQSSASTFYSSGCGGILGSSNGTTTILYCYNSGNIQGQLCVSGILGTSFSKATVMDCYNTGNISGTKQVCGIGGNTIVYCYNLGNISCNGDDSIACGIVVPSGSTSNNNRFPTNISITIAYCYSIGTVSTTSESTYVSAISGKAPDSFGANFYLEGSATCAFYNYSNDTYTPVEYAQGQVDIVATEALMKTKANEVLSGRQNWKQGVEGVNNGYPTLDI